MKKHSFHRLVSTLFGGRPFAAGILAMFVLSFNAPSASADLKLGTPFSDNMVIQRDQEVTIWGEANPGSDVEIQLGDETASSEADTDGRWKVCAQASACRGALFSAYHQRCRSDQSEKYPFRRYLALRRSIQYAAWRR